MNERLCAYNVLLKIEKDSSYSNIALDKALQSVEKKNRPLVSSLVYGTLERQITLDYVLSQYLKKPLKKTKPEVLTALRLGAYQILFSDKIPPFAAVNESVNIIKGSAFSFATGLVNSVLRKIAENGFSYPETDDELFDMSVRYSCPKELCRHFTVNYGREQADSILSSSIGPAPVFLRVNSLKTNADELMSVLSEEGITAEKLSDTALKVKGGSFEELPSFEKGFFHVQDYSSQLCCEELGAIENETVIDVCAAPGGKSFTVAEMMNNKGRVYSLDLYSQRARLIEEGAERLSLSIINTAVNDASVYNSSLPPADRVLCDVPCSGLGVIRRKKEIRFKPLDSFDNLCQMQYNILTVSARYVRSGGTLVYSTCTLNPDENERNCERFIKENGGFRLETVKNIFPYMYGSDGFFIARFVRE
jgi:16S rRNA (cytosine967-C5)-methyltransferase